MPMFSSKCFIVLTFTFRSFINFQLNLYMIHSSGPTFMLLSSCPSSGQLYKTEDTILCPSNHPDTTVENHLTINVWFISGLLIQFH